MLVDAGERLVQQQDAGFLSQTPRNECPLPLSARQLADLPVPRSGGLDPRDACDRLGSGAAGDESPEAVATDHDDVAHRSRDEHRRPRLRTSRPPRLDDEQRDGARDAPRPAAGRRRAGLSSVDCRPITSAMSVALGRRARRPQPRAPGPPIADSVAERSPGGPGQCRDDDVDVVADEVEVGGHRPIGVRQRVDVELAAEHGTG